MSLAVSTDYGLTWKSYGQIITSKDAVVTAHKITGTGDCTAVNGQDGYYYAYCWQNATGHGDGATIMARAPCVRSGSEQVEKVLSGQWDQPGLGGEATGLERGWAVVLPG